MITGGLGHSLLMHFVNFEKFLFSKIMPNCHSFCASALKSSPPVITFFPISEFSYKLIRFLLHSSIVKSDNEIGKFFY